MGQLTMLLSEIMREAKMYANSTQVSKNEADASNSDNKQENIVDQLDIENASLVDNGSEAELDDCNEDEFTKRPLKLHIENSSCVFETIDMQRRDVNRNTQRLHMSILYAIYGILCIVILNTVSPDKWIDWFAMMFLILYLLTLVEIFMDPLYKDTVCRKVVCSIKVLNDELIMKHDNAFGRLIVHKYKLVDIESIEYIPVPGRLIIKGMQTYEIHINESDYMNNVKPVKSVKITDKAYVRVSNDEITQVVKFLEEQCNIKAIEL